METRALKFQRSKPQLGSMGEEVGISWEYQKSDGSLGLVISMV